MGGNGSYLRRNGGVMRERRTHLDTHKHIDGHKILLQSASTKQSKNIMYSNSDSPIYLISKLKQNGEISIQKLNVFEGHKLKMEINLKFDSNGNIKGYNASNHDAGSHAHIWEETKSGRMDRKHGADGKEIHMAIPAEYSSLIDKIVQFNKSKTKYHAS